MLKRLLIVLFLFPVFLNAQSYPPKPTNYVTDETGTLTREQLEALNSKLKAFEDTTTNQVFVYLAMSLNGNDLAQYSQEIFHNWKIGQKDKNNGVLIAIFKDDHKFRIQTGYGLEGVLPDLLTKRIQDDDMHPRFKEGDYYEGINNGVNKLLYYTNHTFTPEPVKPLHSMWESWLIGYCTNALFLVLYIRNVLKGKKNLSKKQKKQKGGQSLRKTILITIAVIVALFPCVGGFVLMLLVIFTSDFKGISSRGSYSSSSWSNSSDSSWSSSDSSSDFSGGGGGDSGGGGSSSDW